MGQTWTALDEIGVGKPEVNPVPERNAGCMALDEIKVVEPEVSAAAERDAVTELGARH